MDFDGFLLQMRIELERLEQMAAPLWDQAQPDDDADLSDEIH